MPSEETFAFLAWAREHIIDARIKIALHSVTPRQEADLWRLVDALELLIKARAQSLDAELEQIDRELEHRFRRGGQITCSRPAPR